MSMSAEVVVNNQKMLEAAALVNEAIDEGLDRAGKLIVDLASQLAPKDSGALSESGDYQITNHTLIVSFGNGLPDDRAIAQEFGTMYMPAQPYLSVAVKNIDIASEVAIGLREKFL